MAGYYNIRYTYMTNWLSSTLYGPYGSCHIVYYLFFTHTVKVLN